MSERLSQVHLRNAECITTVHDHLVLLPASGKLLTLSCRSFAASVFIFCFPVFLSLFHFAFRLSDSVCVAHAWQACALPLDCSSTALHLDFDTDCVLLCCSGYLTLNLIFHLYTVLYSAVIRFMADFRYDPIICFSFLFPSNKIILCFVLLRFGWESCLKFPSNYIFFLSEPRA